MTSAAFFSASFGFSVESVFSPPKLKLGGFADPSELAPKPKDGFAASAVEAPNVNDGLEAAVPVASVLPNPNPVLTGSFKSDFFPKVNPVAAGLAVEPKLKPVVAGFGAASVAGLSGVVKLKLGVAAAPPTLKTRWSVFCDRPIVRISRAQ